MKREEEFERFLKYADTQRYSADERPIAWDAWLAAKHDAKPIAEFHHCKYSDNSEYWVLVDGSDLGKQFYNKKEGEEYAIANGYRLE